MNWKEKRKNNLNHGGCSDFWISCMMKSIHQIFEPKNSDFLYFSNFTKTKILNELYKHFISEIQRKI